MDISRKTDYAVRVLMGVAEAEAEGQTCTASQVARRKLVPKPFVRKIITELASLGLLQTRRGRRGGLRLGVPAHSVTLRNILETIEGPIYLNRCLIRPGECALDRFCAARGVWRRAQEAMLQALDSLTLADLVAEGKVLRMQWVKSMAERRPGQQPEATPRAAGAER